MDNIITTKNKFYEYEKELRLFIFHQHNENENKNIPYDISEGRRLKIDLNELIDEIYLSPFVGKWFDTTLIAILNTVNPELSKKIKNSEILDH